MATKESRNYSFQRSYYYDSHDAEGNFNGMTEDEWKDMIRGIWTCSNLKANHVIFAFHDKDKDKDGLPKGLHAHGCGNFTESISQSVAIERTGCSRDKDCEAITRKAKAYRYLLHITEKAIHDGKYLYGEDCLEYSITEGQKVDYHKLIKASEEEEDAKDDKQLLNKTIKQILKGAYGDDGSILNKLLLNEDIFYLIGKKPANKQAIDNAIKIRQKMILAKRIEEQKKVSDCR